MYAAAFSFAYVTLSAGTGALILFGAVQLTMILAGLRAGERPSPLEWSGLALAVSGLVVLVLPGLTAPAPVGAALMAAAGMAWGVYSLRGRGSTDALRNTAGNFLLTLPMAALLLLIAGGAGAWTAAGSAARRRFRRARFGRRVRHLVHRAAFTDRHASGAGAAPRPRDRRGRWRGAAR